MNYNVLKGTLIINQQKMFLKKIANKKMCRSQGPDDTQYYFQRIYWTLSTLWNALV